MNSSLKPANRFRKMNDLRRLYPVVFSLDVHTLSTYVIGQNIETGESLYDGNVPGNFRHALEIIDRLGFVSAQTLILYEAGNQGFVPYHIATSKGYSSMVIAPSSLPGRRVRRKTDRDDAIENLSSFLSGRLRFVTVPDKLREQARDLLRFRNDQVGRCTQLKHQALGLVRRQGLVYTETKTHWTKAHRKWFETVAMDPLTRILLDTILQNLSVAEKQVDTLDSALLKIIVENAEYAELFQLFRKIPGIGPNYAMILILEGPPMNCFLHPNGVMNYSGLVCAKNASGQTDPTLGITKAGNPHLRRAYVGIAKAYANSKTAYSPEELAKFPEPLRTFLEKLQGRLYKKHVNLKLHYKHINKVRCAVARELCGFVWELVVKVQPLLKQAA